MVPARIRRKARASGSRATADAGALALPPTAFARSARAAGPRAAAEAVWAVLRERTKPRTAARPRFGPLSRSPWNDRRISRHEPTENAKRGQHEIDARNRNRD